MSFHRGGCLDIGHSYCTHRRWWIQPHIVAFSLRHETDRFHCFCMGLAALQHLAQTDKMSGHRLNRLWTRLPRMLNRVTVYGQTMQPGIGRIAVFARQDLTISLPATWS